MVDVLMIQWASGAIRGTVAEVAAIFGGAGGGILVALLSSVSVIVGARPIATCHGGVVVLYKSRELGFFSGFSAGGAASGLSSRFCISSLSVILHLGAVHATRYGLRRRLMIMCASLWFFAGIRGVSRTMRNLRSRVAVC